MRGKKGVTDVVEDCAVHFISYCNRCISVRPYGHTCNYLACLVVTRTIIDVLVLAFVLVLVHDVKHSFRGVNGIHHIRIKRRQATGVC